MNQRFADESTGMVDLTMMKAFIESVWYKQTIYQILLKYGQLNLAKSHHEIYICALDELRWAKPFQIAQ